MLPSKRKVTRALFKSVLEKGRSYASEHFSLRVVFLSQGLTRFAIVVPKKVEKSAVKRNIPADNIFKSNRRLGNSETDYGSQPFFLFLFRLGGG